MLIGLLAANFTIRPALQYFLVAHGIKYQVCLLPQPYFYSSGEMLMLPAVSMSFSQ